VSWIWGGVVLMALGGLVALIPTRKPAIAEVTRNVLSRQNGTLVAKYSGALTPELLEKYVAEVTAK
jgi:hypothetical protein